MSHPFESVDDRMSSTSPIVRDVVEESPGGA
jgi:hypothetical protein